MKKLMIALSSILISLSASAEFSKAQKDSIRCIRSAVESRRFDQASATELARAFKEAKTNPGVRNECKSIRKQIRHNPKLRKDQALEMLKELTSASPQADEYRNEFHDFQYIVRPLMDCKAFGLDVELGAILSVGIGMSVARCEATNGRNYLVVVPTADAGLGGGVFLNVKVNEKFTIIDHSIQDDRADHLYRAIILGGDYLTDTPHFLIGAGIAMTEGRRVAIRLFPTGNNLEYWNFK